MPSPQAFGSEAAGAVGRADETAAFGPRFEAEAEAAARAGVALGRGATLPLAAVALAALGAGFGFAPAQANAAMRPTETKLTIETERTTREPTPRTTMCQIDQFRAKVAGI
jgi:hypothetical protein